MVTENVHGTGMSGGNAQSNSSPAQDVSDLLDLQHQALQNVELGMVVVNAIDGSAEINPEAARILRIPAGHCPFENFIAGLEELRLCSVNASELAVQLSQLLTEPDARISKWLWHLQEPAAHVRVSISPLRSNTLAGQVWVFEDVSDLFDALHNVRSLENRMHQLLSEGDLIAFRLRRGGEFQWLSHSTMRIMGFNESSYLGRNALDLCHPADVPLFIQKVKRMHATGEPQRVTIRVNDAAGRVRSLEGRIFFSHDDHESIEAIMFDVTTHIELQKLRVRVTSAASHEFKTPLAFMTTTLTMISDGILDPSCDQGREIIDRMLSSSKRLARMSDALLTLQHLDITRMLVINQAVNAGQLVEKAALTVPCERGVTINTRDQGGDARVRLDSDLLEQAVINLVDNAVRHSPSGGVVDVVTRVDDDIVTITVQDQGPGVPEDCRSSIFEPFVRIRRDRSGNGLGLAIVHRIAQLHHGSIVVDEPEDGIGSIFTLTLTNLGGRP